MSGRIDAERILEAFLAPGADRLPDRVLDAALDDIDRTPQRRALRVPWRFPIMPAISRATGIAAVALVAIVGAGAIIYLTSPGGSGSNGQQTPAPTQTSAVQATQSPLPSVQETGSPLLSTANWTSYTSSQYGFTVGRPPDWSVAPATRPWTYEADGTADYETPAVDTFQSAEGDIGVSAWVVPFEPGAEPEESWETVQAWIEAYCPITNIRSCGVVSERAEHLCVEATDCHQTGLLVTFDDAVQAFFFGGVAVEGGMTVVSVWWPEAAPATARYGGSRALLEAFLGTMNVWPEDRRPEDGRWPPPSGAPGS